MDAVRLAVVWNPSKSTSREELEDALNASLPDGAVLPVVTWWETTLDDPGQGVTRDAVAASADVVVAAGGDGTVRAVCEALAELDDAPPLGVVPLGTGNLLARNLDVPLNDPRAAFERILSAEPQHIDVAWAELGSGLTTRRQAFVVMAGFGIDAHMITETDDELKARAGWLAYVESLGRAVDASSSLDLEVSIDGEPARRERAHTVLIGSCGAIQGGITLLPDADPSDGELDVAMLRAEGVLGWLETMRSVVWDNGVKRQLFRVTEAESTDSVWHTRATSVAIQLSEPRVCELDGDQVGEVDRVSVTIQPGAVRVL